MMHYQACAGLSMAMFFLFVPLFYCHGAVAIITQDGLAHSWS